MTFNSDGIDSGDDEVAIIVCPILPDCPAHSFCFGLLRAISANDLNVSCCFMFGFRLVEGE